jgi:hypothetical protein
LWYVVTMSQLSQGISKCWCDNSADGTSSPPGNGTRLYQLSGWTSGAACCTRKGRYNNQNCKAEGTTLGNCDGHCQKVSPDAIEVCVEVILWDPGRQKVIIDTSSPKCLSVSPSKDDFILGSFEYGRKKFTIDNNKSCSTSQETVQFEVMYKTPGSNRQPISTQWTLDPFFSH